MSIDTGALSESLFVSGPVAVYLCEAKRWCRATIINSSLDDPARVKVQLLDYGVIVVLPWSCVRPLK
jgi:hypothetical protein